MENTVLFMLYSPLFYFIYKQPNIIKMIITAPATKSWSFIAIHILKAIQTDAPYSSIRIALVINQGEQSIRN